MLAVTVKDDIDKAIERGVNRAFKQVPFAIAVSLTETAKDLDDAISREMPRNFTIRRPWVVQGIRIRPATKAKLEAQVYSRDPFMGLQETGGTKRPINRRVFDYQGWLAIPLDARRSKADVVNQRDWPENLVRPFVFQARDGRMYLAVHELNTAKGAKSVRSMRGKQKRSTGMRLMYTLVRSVQLKERLHMGRTAKRIVPERFNHHFPIALQRAVSTAR